LAFNTFEIDREIRKFEQRIKNLVEMFMAEEAEEAQKNSWGAWLMSPYESGKASKINRKSLIYLWLQATSVPWLLTHHLLRYQHYRLRAHVAVVSWMYILLRGQSSCDLTSAVSFWRHDGYCTYKP
jgi:hypothetical protein